MELFEQYDDNEHLISEEVFDVEVEAAPEAAPAPNGNPENWSNEVLAKMAYHLKKTKNHSITIEQATEQLLTDSTTRIEYKKLKEMGKF